MMDTCQICGDDAPSDTTRFLPLFVVGSEGVIVCERCRMDLTETARRMRSIAARCRLAGARLAGKVTP